MFGTKKSYFLSCQHRHSFWHIEVSQIWVLGFCRVYGISCQVEELLLWAEVKPGHLLPCLTQQCLKAHRSQSSACLMGFKLWVIGTLGRGSDLFAAYRQPLCDFRVGWHLALPVDNPLPMSVCLSPISISIFYFFSIIRLAFRFKI